MEVKRLEGHYSQTATPLIFGCDANTHHTLWGSMDKNQRVADLQDYLASTNLDIDNVGKKPTFRISTSAKVIDITLCLTSIVNQIWHWRALKEVWSTIQEDSFWYYNPKILDVAKYNVDLASGKYLRRSRAHCACSKAVDFPNH